MILFFRQFKTILSCLAGTILKAVLFTISTMVQVINMYKFNTSQMDTFYPYCLEKVTTCFIHRDIYSVMAVTQVKV